MLYTITSTLPPTHGGRTKALLNRIKFLEENLQQQSTILTTNYNANYKNIYRIFREKGLITNSTMLENIYDWLANHRLLEEPVEPKLFGNLPIKTKVKVSGLKAKKDGDDVKYFDGKDYVMFRKFYKDRKIMKYEDSIDPHTNTVKQRKEYTLNGRLHKVNHFDNVSTFKISEEYYDIDGYMYLKITYDNNEDNKLNEIQYYKDANNPIIFKKEKALFRYYYNHVLKDGSVVFNDARLLDRPLIECENNIKRILVFHSNHLQNNKVRSSYKLALDNHEKN